MLGDALREAAGLVAPQRCAGCHRLGRAWCGRCASDVAARTLGPYRVLSPPAAEAGLAVWAYVPYEGPVRSVVGAWKDDDRRDLRGVLAPMLAASLRAASASRPPHPGPTLVVPVPSSARATRRRGDWPLRDLARCAAGTMPVVAALRQVVPAADQAGLTARARRRNRRGAFAAVPGVSEVLRGARVLLVDDLVTTGSSLVDAARAVREAEAEDVLAAVVAASELRRPGGVSRT